MSSQDKVQRSDSQVADKESAGLPTTNPDSEKRKFNGVAESNQGSGAAQKEKVSRTWRIPMGELTWAEYMSQDIDPLQASGALSAFSFMTGYTCVPTYLHLLMFRIFFDGVLSDAISFSAVFVWCGFQTGNWTQLALALARLFSGPVGSRDLSFHIADQQALCSLLTFWIGSFSGRIGDKLGAQSRRWMVLGTFMQTLATMVAAIVIWKSGQGSVAETRGTPAWTNALTFAGIGFMSAALGLQGVMGKRLNTQFTTTSEYPRCSLPILHPDTDITLHPPPVVLTTVWCELFTDPQLFNFRKTVLSRDLKVLEAVVLFLGGFIARAILDQIGAAGALGVGTGLRLLVTFSWLFVPAKKPKV
jgi:hypothetical protein